MKLNKILKIGKAFLGAKLFGKRTPLIVGWAITDRCNRNCSYCARGKAEQTELTTEQVFQIIDQLAQAGTLSISFTGGEPLVREDIGKIIDYADQKGIMVKLNSNGSLVKAKLDELKHLSVLNLSFEGPEEVHNAIRGPGSYQQVMEAVKTAQENVLKVSFTTVLNKKNFNAIDFILTQARELGIKVTFQTATTLVLSGNTFNPLLPSEIEYQEAINKLIKEKKRGNKAIANSLAALKHLSHWPDPKELKCASGFISCRIEPNGDVIYCSREPFKFLPFNCGQAGFNKAFAQLKPIKCNNCWCAARVELNLAYSGNLSAILKGAKT